MNRLIISGGTVIDPESGTNEKCNVLIKDGRIFGLTNDVPSEWNDASTIDASEQWVIPGLICLRTHVGEPGTEWKEDIHTASQAAANGGFTTICATPDTSPVNDFRAVTEQIARRSESASGARVLPVGAATIGLGKAGLTEMGELKSAGCAAISTGDYAVESSSLMRCILEYARTVNLPVFTVADDPSLGHEAVMHEGAVSVRLGMKAVPAESECISLYRDAMLSRLADWPIHFQKVSTAMALELLEQLKNDGHNITASVTPHHLWFTDEHITSFDTNTRVRPPLRSQSDVEALRNAVSSGLVSAIVTDHRPQTSIEKAIEYQWAEPGTTGLESTLPAMLDLVRQGAIELNAALKCLTSAPATILGKPELGRVAEGCVANLTLIDPHSPNRADSARMASKSRNCIFDGVSMTGSVEQTIVEGCPITGQVEEIDVNR